MESARAVVVLGLVVLAGCYESHAPWERAAPDGSAIWMRVELHGGVWGPGAGFLEVRSDRTYAASPMNRLGVCTGTLTSAQLDGWIALIERTGAFNRAGSQNTRPIADAGWATVMLASEGGLATRFGFAGGPALYDPSLEGFWSGAEELWATLDVDDCLPEVLDPATSSLRGRVNPLLSSEGGVWFEVGPGGAVSAFFGYGWFVGDELEPCAPLADADRFWATVLASAPYDRRRPEDAWREAGGFIDAEITAADGTTHPRSVHFNIQPSRPEQARLLDAFVTLVETRCRR